MMELSMSTNQKKSCQILLFPLLEEMDKRTIGNLFAPLIASILSCTRLSLCGIGRFEN